MILAGVRTSHGAGSEDGKDQDAATISKHNAIMQRAPAVMVPPAPPAVPSPSTPKARREDEQGEQPTSASPSGEGEAAAQAVVRRKLRVDVSDDGFRRSPFPLSPPGSESVVSPADPARMAEIKRKLDKEQKWVDKMFAATQVSGGERPKRNQPPSEEVDSVPGI